MTSSSATALSPPHFVQSFLRLPHVHFLQRLPESLDQRLRRNRRADPTTGRALEVLRLEPVARVGRWAAELAAALAWLEGTLGVVHGDLRMANFLLDEEEHLKVVDFDSCAALGDMGPSLPPPWARGKGGRYALGNEQCAFGTFLYTLTRGAEPFEDSGPEIFGIWRRKEFPELSESPLDVLTRRCWMDEFASMADLATEALTLEGAETALMVSSVADDEYISRMKKTCEEIVRTKLADLGDGLPEDIKQS